MEQSDKDIQDALRHLKSIAITKKDVTLRLKNTTLRPTLNWLKGCLTDAVNTVKIILSMTKSCYCPARDEILRQIAASRKKINIFINCWEHPTDQEETKVTIREHKLSISMEYRANKFASIPPALLDALSNGGNIPQDLPFRTITAEKHVFGKTGYTITGIKLINEVIKVEDDYLEFLSKLPNLNSLELKWIPDKPTTKSLTQHISINASGLEELIVNGIFSDQMIASVNTIVSQCKRLKKLAICRRFLVNFEVMAENARSKKANRTASEPPQLLLHNSIQELNIKCRSDQIKLFIEPLRLNRTITSLSIELDVFSDTIDEAEDLMDLIEERSNLKKLDIRLYSNQENCTYLLETALANKNITCLDVARTDSVNFGDNCVKLLMTNPYLVELSDSKYEPEELQHHIATNRRKREAMQIDLITIMYSVARTFNSGLNYLPKEMWCTIMSYYEYPGIDQPFGDILRELFVNSTIRRVIRDQ